MKKLVFILLLVLFITPVQVQALEMLSDDEVTITSPIDDDVFASGGSLNINAPISGAVVSGGTVNINAPIERDLFVAGGDVNINSDVGGKIVAAGGSVNIAGNVGTNAVIAGGNVRIHSTSTIGRDTIITGGSVVNEGKITGNLTVRSGDFQNTGTAGMVDYQRTEFGEGFMQDVRGLLNILGTLITLGLIIPGILMVRLFPAPFMKVEQEVRRSPIKNTVLGFILAIVSVVMIAILAITVVGLTLAIIMGMFFLVAIMLSSLFVSYSVGHKIRSMLNKEMGNMAVFIIGFVILYLLFRIPFAGPIIGIIVTSLGFGAIIFAIRANWKQLTAKSES